MHVNLFSVLFWKVFPLCFLSFLFLYFTQFEKCRNFFLLLLSLKRTDFALSVIRLWYWTKTKSAPEDRDKYLNAFNTRSKKKKALPAQLVSSQTELYVIKAILQCGWLWKPRVQDKYSKNTRTEETPSCDCWQIISQLRWVLETNMPAEPGTPAGGPRRAGLSPGETCALWVKNVGRVCGFLGRWYISKLVVQFRQLVTSGGASRMCH